MVIFSLTITVATSIFLLGLITLLKNRHSFLNITFFLFAVTLAVWVVTNYYSNDLSLSYNLTLWLNRATLLLPCVSFYFLLMFCLLFTKLIRSKIRLIALITGLLTIGISILSSSHWILAGIYAQGNVNALKFGPLTWLYASFIIGAFLSVITTLRLTMRHSQGAVRTRLQYMGISLFLAIAIMVIADLILPLMTNNYSYVTIGPLSTLIIVAGFTYAIIRHRLFDIRTVVARSIAYLLLLLTLGTLYGLITFKIGSFLFGSTSLTTTQQTFNIATAIVLAFTFQPLRRFFEKITDKIFYRDQYEPRELINQIGRILASEIELLELTSKVSSIMSQQMRIEHVDIVVLSGGKIFLGPKNHYTNNNETLADDLAKLGDKILVQDELPENEQQNILNKYRINLFATLQTREEKVGYLLFGSKLSGDIFTSVDIQVTNIIIDQLAVAIQNAKSYTSIQHFNQTLQLKIKNATRQLSEANASLQKLDQVKDEFLSMASHQLGTPLSVIEGYLSMILRGTYGTLNPKQEHALSETLSRLHLTEALVADLLNISRITAGRFFIEKEPADLNNIVQEEIKLLQSLAKEKNVKLSFKQPSNPVPIINIDKQKTRQAIMNLVDNAIDYTPNGKVDVYLESDDKDVIFRVVDNGIGVKEEQKDKLFTKFFRSDNAKQLRPDGTGIGLYLVKRVVTDQNGEIIFSSQAGKGSTFGFRLPLQPVLNDEIKQPSQTEKSALVRK